MGWIMEWVGRDMWVGRGCVEGVEAGIVLQEAPVCLWFDGCKKMLRNRGCGYFGAIFTRGFRMAERYGSCGASLKSLASILLTICVE